MDRERGRTYFYIVALFSMGILIYSFYILYNSLTSYQEGQTENLYIGIVVAIIGIGLAFSSLTTLRKRAIMMKEMDKKVLTVEFCDKCSFKKVRLFEKGDYVNKKIGKCTQCNSELSINAIYLEDKKEPDKSPQRVSTSQPSSLTITVCSA
ncbi:hypothetical protein AC481_01390 [miscellaneous Crenarchaeota group archaeon SMTZ-80]|nr:MAG: hypothetical protein AC481_01390 [miscellaneous Crenarchaeota group archaeon SMTZ-80]